MEVENDEEEERAMMNKNKARKEDEKPKAVPKCWHYPGYHINKDCEVLRNKQRQPENWREAEGTPVTPAPNAEDRK